MAFEQPYGFEFAFVRNPISGSAAWFFVNILKLISEPIFKIKIYEKISWYKQISFSKADFHKSAYQITKKISILNSKAIISAHEYNYFSA